MRTGRVTYMECSYLLRFLHTRGMAFLLPVICETGHRQHAADTEQEWQDLRMLVHCTVRAENEDINMDAQRTKCEDGRLMWCEVDGACVSLVTEGRTVSTRKRMSPAEARRLATVLLRAASRAA